MEQKRLSREHLIAAFDWIADKLARAQDLEVTRSGVMLMGERAPLPAGLEDAVIDLLKGARKPGIVGPHIEVALAPYVRKDGTLAGVAGVVLKNRREIVHGWWVRGSERTADIVAAKLLDANAIILSHPTNNQRRVVAEFLYAIRSDRRRPTHVHEIRLDDANDYRHYLAGSSWVKIPASERLKSPMARALTAALQARSVRQTIITEKTAEQYRLIALREYQEAGLSEAEIGERLGMAQETVEETKRAPIGPPSPRQLRYAERLAEKAGVPLPNEARLSARACGAFIDGHVNDPIKATDKQIATVDHLTKRYPSLVPHLPADWESSKFETSRFLEIALGATDDLDQTLGPDGSETRVTKLAIIGLFAESAP